MNSNTSSQIQRPNDLCYDIQIKCIASFTVLYVNVIILGETSGTKLILKVCVLKYIF